MKEIVRHIAAYIGYDKNRALCGVLYRDLRPEDIPGSHLCRNCARIEGIR